MYINNGQRGDAFMEQIEPIASMVSELRVGQGSSWQRVCFIRDSNKIYNEDAIHDLSWKP